MAASLVLLTTMLLIKAPKHKLLGATILAGLFFGCHQILYITATQKTSIAMVTMIGSTSAVWVALLSQRVVGEAVPAKVFGYAAIAVVGVSITAFWTSGNAGHSTEGIAYAVANVCVFTGYLLASKVARTSGVPTLAFTTQIHWIAAFMVVPFALWRNGGTLPYPSFNDAVLLAIMVCGPGNGHLLLNWAHPRVPAALVGVFVNIVPLLASLWAYLLLGEVLTKYHAIGFALVLVGIEGARRTLSGTRMRSVSSSSATHTSSPPP